jgi:UTP---glucose-1-phosphate uridylyltransferase
MVGSLVYKNFSTFKNLEHLADQLKEGKSVDEKLAILNTYPWIDEEFRTLEFIKTFYPELPKERELIIKAVIVIGQGDRVFHSPSEWSRARYLEQFEKLMDQLLSIETFYAEIGGIVGYQRMIFHLLLSKEESSQEAESYHHAEGLDLSQESEEVLQAIMWGVSHLDQMAEIYPLGGAADRLGLIDENTGDALPAAKLLFAGKTLLEGMIADLQAREYLRYKLFGKQTTTPLAIMTSQEKGNHAQILALCEEKKWFGRPKESFCFFCQPSVPTVNKKGEWCLRSPMQLLLKPGGHGVIWKLAQEKGVFDWLYSQGRSKALVRQINNPIAGADYGLLAFSGLGCHNDKKFGFASCPRLHDAKEGTNVLIERRCERAYEYVLTNIEYCDLRRQCMIEASLSKFSANTNLLFVDLRAVERVTRAFPFPGRIVNFRKSTYRTETGEEREEEIARVESMMQNIADMFVDSFPSPLEEGQRDQLQTFITHHLRRKTISTTKQRAVEGLVVLETPESTLFDHLENMKELLGDQCGMEIAREGPLPFLFFYHPALGPLYKLIAQKIRGGRLAPGSELQLHIADLDMEGLDLEGSLRIEAECPMGALDREGIVHYSNQTGKCLLKNVKVNNRGIDREAPNRFWKNHIFRKEGCHIVIQGNGEFYAEDVTLSGAMEITVASGTRVVAVEKEGEVIFEKERIEQPSWQWDYSLQESNHRIVIEKNASP